MHILANKAVLDQVSEGQWCSSTHLGIYGIAARNPEVARLVRFYSATPQLLTESMHKDHEHQDKLLFQCHMQLWLLVQLLLKVTLFADCPIDMQHLV